MNATSGSDETSGGVVPVDLLAALALTVALNVAVFLPVVRGTPARVPLGLAFALFVPGYVLVAAVFPERYTGDRRGGADAAGRAVADGVGITFLERALLSVGCSVLVVPAVGYALNFTLWGVRLVPVLLVTSGVTFVVALVAWARRLQVPPASRFRAAGPVEALSKGAPSGDGETSTAVTVVLVGAVAFFALSTGYAAVGASTGEGYSELYLVDAEGDRLADGNISVPADGSRDLRVGVGNAEGRPVEYTVVVLSQRVATDGNRTTVREQTELNRFEMTVDPGKSVTRPTGVPAAASGSDRVTWLLYTDRVPETISGETADYQVYLWLEGASVAGNGEGGTPANVGVEGE